MFPIRHHQCSVPCTVSQEPGLLGGDVAPLLDDGSLHLVGVSLGPGTDLLRDIHTLLHRHQLGNQLGYLVARLDGLQGALFHGLLHHHSLDSVVTDDGALSRM